MDLSVAAVVILGGLVAVRWIVILIGAALIMRPALQCPACFEETLPLHRPLLTALLPSAEWRWCPSCGWQGPSRKPERNPWRTKRKSATSET